MADSRKLTTDEVNALMEGLSTGDVSGETGVGKDLEVAPFSFGTDDLSLMGDYYALRLINERFARFARSVFQPMLRVQPRISSFPPEVKTFDEYSSSLDSFMSLSTYRIEELRGSLLVVFSPAFISILTNAYYGGNIEVLKTTRQEFTATEERIIEMVNVDLMKQLKLSWKDLTPINFTKLGREMNPQFTNFVDASDLVIICSFVVQLPGVDAANFDIIYPLQTLKPIASLLRSRVQSDIIEDDVSWKDKLESAILEIPLDLKATLSQPMVNMAKLLRVKVGDTIQIPVSDKIDVYVEDIKMFNGDLGEYKGSAAVNIKKRIYKTQRINGLEKKMVTPPKSFYDRIIKENKAIKNIRNLDSDIDFIFKEFNWPAKGIISGVFGSQRILNGKPKRPHYGIDIAAKKGTSVLAPIESIVRMAEKDLYYTGGTIMLDHGHGVTSVYSHLSLINVNVGDKVKKGQKIGEIGSTGRSTGPHLDWRINWFLQRLDPALLVP